MTNGFLGGLTFDFHEFFISIFGVASFNSRHHKSSRNGRKMALRLYGDTCIFSLFSFASPESEGARRARRRLVIDGWGAVMREGNLNSRTTPQGSPPEAVLARKMFAVSESASKNNRPRRALRAVAAEGAVRQLFALQPLDEALPPARIVSHRRAARSQNTSLSCETQWDWRRNSGGKPWRNNSGLRTRNRATLPLRLTRR
jgi:hypothetical protein